MPFGLIGSDLAHNAMSSLQFFRPNVRPEFLVGASVASIILSRRLSWVDAEILTDTTCWTILAAIFSLSGLLQPPARKHEPTQRLGSGLQVRSILQWVISTAIVTMSLCSRQGDITCLLPLLAPLTLLVLRHLPSKAKLSERLGVSFSTHDISQSLALSRKTMGSTTLSSVFCILVLLRTFNGGLVFSIVALCAGVLAVGPAIVIFSSDEASVDTNLNVKVASISQRNVLLLLLPLFVEIKVWGVPSMFVVDILLAGLLKATSVYFLAMTARDLDWEVALGIMTFSVISETDSLALPSGWDATLLVMASTFALYNVISTASRHTTLSSLTWFLLLIPIWSNLSTFTSGWAGESNTALEYRHNFGYIFEDLAQSAEHDFRSLLKRQSSSYAEAHMEYQRRYNMSPPLGFQSWYGMAASKKSFIIDDFDVLHRALVPFWEQSGKDVVQAMNNAYETTGSDLWLCTLCDDGNRETICKHASRTFDRHLSELFDGLPSEICQMFPDITVLVNHLDEPRVVVPPHEATNKHTTSDKLLSDDGVSGHASWKAITSGCGWQRGKGPDDSQMLVTTNLPFVSNMTSAMDLCSHPEYSRMHGLFINPTSFKMLKEMAPVFSAGVPSTMGDMPIPSPAYAEDEFQYNALEDYDWEQKQNNLYWVGSTTGGYAADEQWHSFHRQRFVALAQGLKPRRQFNLIHNHDKTSVARHRSFNRRLWDVAFTRVNQCTPTECRNQKAYFKTKPWVPSHRALRSRLVFDMDGNGISGRYYQLLASSSTPLKQTLLREWHDDRLVPWVHYIPVSQSLEELPELVTYLTSTKNGQRLAKRVAHQGQQWAAKALRQEDRDVYVFRLVIELARLQNTSRPAQKF